MVAAVVVRAAGDPSGEAAKSGPWGLAIILLLCLACYFLFKSMSKHMRKVREQFPIERGRTRPGTPGAQAPPPAATPTRPTRPTQDQADTADGEPRRDGVDPGSPDTSA